MASDFASAAQRFCSIIEERSPSSARLWLLKVEAALADLYAAAIALPDVGPSADLPVRRQSTEEWMGLFEAIRSRLGPSDLYWRVADPFDRRSLVEASIADDLTHIYRGVHGGLTALRSGAPPETVLFGWRTNFVIDWATLAVNALNAIREILRSDAEFD